MIVTDFGSFDLNEDGLRLFEKWKNGDLSGIQLKILLEQELMKPPNHGVERNALVGCIDLRFGGF